MRVLIYQLKGWNGNWYPPQCYAIKDNEDLQRVINIGNSCDDCHNIKIINVPDEIEEIDILNYVDEKEILK